MFLGTKKKVRGKTILSWPPGRGHIGNCSDLVQMAKNKANAQRKAEPTERAHVEQKPLPLLCTLPFLPQQIITILTVKPV